MKRSGNKGGKIKRENDAEKMRKVSMISDDYSVLILRIVD